MLRRWVIRLAAWIVRASGLPHDLDQHVARIDGLLLDLRDRVTKTEAQGHEAVAQLTSHHGDLDCHTGDIATVQAQAIRLRDTLAAHGEQLAALRDALLTRAQEEQREVWFTRLRAFSAEQRAVLERVTTALELPAWPDARAAVRQCATTLGFNHPEMWREYSRAIKADAGQAENVFRHLKAVDDLKAVLQARGLTLDHPTLHLVVELAYQGFASESP